jgi:hypothetical protein
VNSSLRNRKGDNSADDDVVVFLHRVPDCLVEKVEVFIIYRDAGIAAKGGKYKMYVTSTGKKLLLVKS